MLCYATSFQSCSTLCNPMDYSLQGSSVWILQARILEWVAIFSFRGSSQPRDPARASYISCIGRQVLYHSAVLSHSVMSQLFATSWTVAPSLLCPWGFSRQEYWSGLPCPPPGDLPNPGIEPRSSSLQADSLPYEPPGKPTNFLPLVPPY